MRDLFFFIINLRWHYQLFVLSGCFLFGGLFSPSMDWGSFLPHLLIVHLLLFGGATAFNSYWDKDKGPVGGLKRVPPMREWMRPVSLLIQLPGLVAGWWIGWEYILIYGISMLMFWLYSTPLFRWKGRPILSLIAIGVSTGWGGFWLGALSAGGTMFDSPAWIGSIGVMLIILSMYPLSQIYQVEEDRTRGDQTFMIAYGLESVKAFYIVSFGLGVIASSTALILIDWLTGGLFFLVASLSGMMVWTTFSTLNGVADEYEQVMKIKYMASVLFVIFITFTLIHIHLFNMGKPVYPGSQTERFANVELFGSQQEQSDKHYFYEYYNPRHY